jgi:hypothetical protein
METKILKVVAQGETFTVPSKKSENGQLAKCVIRLKELSEYGDEFNVTMLGNLASCRFPQGKIVAATLRFQTHESNGQFYQDIVASDIQALS